MLLLLYTHISPQFSYRVCIFFLVHSRSFDFSILFLLILVHLFKNFAEEKKNG